MAPTLQDLRRYAIGVAITSCLLLGAASALRVVGSSHLFPTETEDDPTPIAFDDYALQFYYGQLGSRFLAEGGVSHGYDPNFLAGYPKTPIYYPSSKPYELSLRIFDGSDPGRVFNWTVFSMLATLPLLMFGAGINFQLSPLERLALVALSVIPHLLVPTSGFYGIMEAAGMVPFILSSFLSVFVVSLVFRFLVSGARWAGLALLLTAPLLYLCHLTAVLISALPIVTIYFKRFRVTPLRSHVWMWLIFAVVVAANWFWIEGYFLFAHYSDLGDFYTPEGARHFVIPGGVLAPFHVHVPSPKIVSLVPPVFGIYGLYCWARERSGDLLVLFVLQIVFLFIICFYGVLFGLAAIDPARITLPLMLYLLIPAAHGLATFVAHIRDWMRRALTPQWRAVVAVLAVGSLASAAFATGFPAKVWRPFTLPGLEKREGFSEHGMALIYWLSENTDPNGRILHEETDRKSHQYYGSHMAAWIPLHSNRQLAGGPAPHPLLKHNFLRFIAGNFQDRPIDDLDEQTLSSYLSLYNVRWVLCWKRSTKRFFGRLPFAERAGDFDKFTLYRIEIPPSYFLHGSGRAEVRGIRILLSDVTPENDRVTIKFHWFERLRTRPPRVIEPIYMLDDPIPFISVMDPPREFEIFDDFGRSHPDR
jgi:hypothetical protein